MVTDGCETEMNLRVESFPGLKIGVMRTEKNMLEN